MHLYGVFTIIRQSKIPLKMVAAVKEKALCAEMQRLSHRRMPQQGPRSTQGYWVTLSSGEKSPREASAKENSIIVIPNQNGT